MRAYKQYVVIEDPNRVVLSNLPFQVGQRVEVLVIADDPDIDTRVEDLRALFQLTQSLLDVQDITDAEIEAEIDAYRSGQ